MSTPAPLLLSSYTPTPLCPAGLQWADSWSSTFARALSDLMILHQVQLYLTFSKLDQTATIALHNSLNPI